MKSQSAWKMFLLVGIVTLAGYFIVFSWIESKRRQNPPWEFTFMEISNAPALLINHPALPGTNTTILFAEAMATTNLPQTIRFEHGQVAPFDLPFGKCVFLDTLFLPGTVACEMFGYEIQVLPRTLTIDKQEYPWATTQKVLFTNRLPATLPPH